MCAKVMIEGREDGELFRVHPQVEEELDLGHTYVCELDMDELSYGLIQAKAFSKYQASFRDLSILIPKSLTYEAIKEVIVKHASADIKRYYPVDRYASESLGDQVSLSLRFVLQSEEKTLEEEEITAAIEWILTGLKEELGVSLR
jgi:phenylalanyl-tRNA synthetase beta chain